MEKLDGARTVVKKVEAGARACWCACRELTGQVMQASISTAIHRLDSEAQ
jgi:hypothetical protein